MDVLANLFPQWALKREQSRQALQHLRLLEHDKTNSRHPRRKMGPHSADAVNQHARYKPRESVRWLEENHPIAVSILDTLTTNIVGEGTVVEPKVMTPGRELATETNVALKKAWQDFMKSPDVTGELCGCEFEQLIIRSWARDGEVFMQHVEDGAAFRWFDPTLRYVVELIEADLVPFDDTRVNREFVHGVRKDAWGRPTAYSVYKDHPGNTLAGVSFGNPDTKTVPAELILHFKNASRIRQTRGRSILAPIIDLLLDLSHYEDAERVAARINATQTITIERATPDPSVTNETTGVNEFRIGPSNVWHLNRGESAKMFAPDRPNTNLEPFIHDQIRRAAAATNVSASTVSRNYNGTYSSQRQELAESFRFYRTLRRKYYEKVLSAMYRKVVTAAVDRRQIPVVGTDIETLFDADYRGPSLVWIDPQKEAKAAEILFDNGFESRQNIIRDKGGDPITVTRELLEDEFEKVSNQPVGQNNDGRNDEDDDSEEDDSEESVGNRNAA